MRDITVNRPTLGPFMSVLCFRYLHDDAEDLAGRALIVDAGRQRGQDIVEQLGKMGSNQSTAEIQKELQEALGPNGTRLCLVQSVQEKENGGYEIHSTECASPIYTLGVLIGSISAFTGKTMLGKDTDIQTNGDGGQIYHIDPF